MSESKRKNVDWAGVANVLFYGSLIAFFILLILGLILQNREDVDFGIIFGITVVAYALFVIIYSRIRYDHNKK